MKGFLISTKKCPQQVDIDTSYYSKREDLNGGFDDIKIVKLNNKNKFFNIFIFSILDLNDKLFKKSVFGDYLLFNPKKHLTENDLEHILRKALSDENLKLSDLNLFF